MYVQCLLRNSSAQTSNSFSIPNLRLRSHF